MACYPVSDQVRRKAPLLRDLRPTRSLIEASYLDRHRELQIRAHRLVCGPPTVPGQGGEVRGLPQVRRRPRLRQPPLLVRICPGLSNGKGAPFPVESARLPAGPSQGFLLNVLDQVRWQASSASGLFGVATPAWPSASVCPDRTFRCWLRPLRTRPTRQTDWDDPACRPQAYPKCVQR